MAQIEFLRDIDWKYALLAIFLFTCSGLAYFYNAEILAGIKIFFETKGLNYFAGAIATAFTLTYKVKTRTFRFSSSMSFNEFRVPLEDILSFVGNPVTLVCSISLAKGLFLQTSENTMYFPFFQSVELGFIALVTSYLFFISMMELVRNIRETVTKKASSKTEVTAIPASEVTQRVPSPVSE
jgi:hypothetical protein